MQCNQSTIINTVSLANTLTFGLVRWLSCDGQSVVKNPLCVFDIRCTYIAVGNTMLFAPKWPLTLKPLNYVPTKSCVAIYCMLNI